MAACIFQMILLKTIGLFRRCSTVRLAEIGTRELGPSRLVGQSVEPVQGVVGVVLGSSQALVLVPGAPAREEGGTPGGQVVRRRQEYVN